MTISIAGYCAKTGQLGIAISSSSIAVGARCPWLSSAVGAVSSQNITLPALGNLTLEQLTQGVDPESALKAALASDPFSDYRQVTVINAQGQTACFSGSKTLGVYNTVQGEHCVVAGNMLASRAVIDAMAEDFSLTTGELTERLINALQVGVSAGGEAGPVHSAAVKVIANHTWPLVDLRIDWSDESPVDKLLALWQDYAPQMQDYAIRAIDPRQAPSYGVPGDE